MKIAIEGMDGVGKSTVSELLAKDLGYEHYEQKLIDQLGMDRTFYKKLMKYVRSSDNKQMSAIFFTLKMMIDNDDNKDSIVERSVTSMVYFEKDNIDEKVLSTIMSLGVIPDITFLLYAPLEQRIERIRKRNPEDSDLKSSEAMVDGYDVMLDFVHQYDIPYIGIDTTNRSAETVAEICKVLIQGFEKCPENRKKEYLKRMNSIYGFDDLYITKGKLLCKKNTT